MKLLILGASKAQLIGITTAKVMGHKVITCDYIKGAVGHGYSDLASYASTFDVEAVEAVAKKENIDGIMTLGTDQPVYTAALVSEHLGLPQVLKTDVALAVTNKKVMKKKFIEHEIPTVPYTLYEKGINEEVLLTIAYPVVIKPIDSQGQRGIFLVGSPSEVIERYESVVAYSRCDEILVETYYPHDEITVSGWVSSGCVSILSITDRVTFESPEHLGICLSHELPSKYLSSYGEAFVELTERITKSFEIQNGPIYYQFLLGEDGIKVNEIACRIGGAHEATFLPIVTGFDITRATINGALNRAIDDSMLKDYKVLEPVDTVSVQLFFCGPCKIKEVPSVDKVMAMDGVIDYSMTLQVNQVIDVVENATSRAGYAVIVGSSKEDLEAKVKHFYDQVKIVGVDGNNHIIHRKIRM